MQRRFRMAAAVAALLVAQGATAARAQYYYPSGYGGWGWGGWGGGGTPNAQIAAGLGAFARGAGVYNVETAQARSINADTVMRWNNYVWSAYDEAERRRLSRVSLEKNQRNRALDEIQKRLRDNPTESDINRGDALNAALVEVRNPKLYLGGMKAAAAPLPGAVIRDIPFQHAASAITASVTSLARENAPAALKENDAFREGREKLKAIGDQIRKEDEEEGHPTKETIAKARETIKGLQAKSAATLAEGSRERREVDNYLKGLMGLSRMLETPAINVLLADVGSRPDTTLGDLVNFMKAFNLRFGVAQTPEQRLAYQQVYPLLDRLRDEATAEGAPTVAAVKRQGEPHQAPAEFFSQMENEHLNAPVPPAPAPKR